MLADSKLGLGIAGNGMEPWQCEKPIRHLTFSTEQRAQVINFWFTYFHSIPFHAHSDTHTTVWLHVYKTIYRKLCVGWVIKVQTPFSTDRRGDRGNPAAVHGWLLMASNDTRKWRSIEIFFSTHQNTAHSRRGVWRTRMSKDHFWQTRYDKCANGQNDQFSVDKLRIINF